MPRNPVFGIQVAAVKQKGRAQRCLAWIPRAALSPACPERALWASSAEDLASQEQCFWLWFLLHQTLSWVQKELCKSVLQVAKARTVFWGYFFCFKQSFEKLCPQKTCQCPPLGSVPSPKQRTEEPVPCLGKVEVGMPPLHTSRNPHFPAFSPSSLLLSGVEAFWVEQQLARLGQNDSQGVITRLGIWDVCCKTPSPGIKGCLEVSVFT